MTARETADGIMDRIFGAEWSRTDTVHIADRDAIESALIAERRAGLDEAAEDKDEAYHERNQCVAALARLFPSGIARTDIPGWLPEWHGCVYIDLPTGQVSWHYHDREAHLFAGLPVYDKPWDGHDTPEKYRRLLALSPAPPMTTEELIAALREGVTDPVTGEPLDDGVFAHVTAGDVKAAADRLASTQVEGLELETTPWERDQWRFGVNPFSKEDRERLLRDFNRMIVHGLQGREAFDRALALAAAERERKRAERKLKKAEQSAAFRRALPDAFDDHGNMKPGRLADVLSAFASKYPGRGIVV